MINLYKSIVTSQFGAALKTLEQSIDRASEEVWAADHVDGPVNRAVFHALIFADLYLCRTEHDIEDQAFHREHRGFFDGYEELKDVTPQGFYDRLICKQYLHFCIEKAHTVIAAETEETLAGQSGFSWRPEPRAELHIYNIRHIQHHAAQLGLRAQLRGEPPVDWVSHG